jgi:hypothetical protein
MELKKSNSIHTVWTVSTLVLILTKFMRTYSTVQRYETKKMENHLDLAYDGIITSGKLQIYCQLFACHIQYV